jgi:hypothetical protein
MKKQIILLMSLSLALSIIGCATLPKPEKMQADIAGYTLPKLPEPGKAIVYVVRPSGGAPIIRFNVFIDDKEDNSEMGYNRASQYIYFNLTPGDHTILSKAENWAEVKVSANADDIIYIQQDPQIGILIARNELKILPDYEGKYHVKNLIPGTIIKTDK